MNATLTGTLFDSNTLAGHAVTLAIGDGRMQSQTAGIVLDVAVTEIRTSDRLAALPRYLYLPGNRTVETPDNDIVDALLAGQNRGRMVALVHWLEGRARVAAGATVLLISSVSAVIGWGLPVLARQAAMAVPASIETKAGQTALLTVNRLLAPSQLKARDRARVERQVDRLVRARGLAEPPELVFRSMGGKSPNAFALPGGLIVVSDELVALASDDELAAVLAHEFGHWQNRHGLQSVLRSSTALLVVSSVSGDLSTLTTFAGTIPFIMLQRGYSREFEAEADAYACDLLEKAGIDVGNFETILQKLEKSRPATGKDFTYLSTHPSTGDRIKALHARAGHAPFAVKAGGEVKLEFMTKLPPVSLASSELPDSDTGPARKSTRPRPLVQTPPIYPTQLEQKGAEGNVTVEFVIDQNGDVQTPRVMKSSQSGFEAAALAAVARWKFTPGEIDGRAVSTRSTITLEFKLDDPPKIPFLKGKIHPAGHPLPDPSPAGPPKP